MAEYNGVMMQYFHWYTTADPEDCLEAIGELQTIKARTNFSFLGRKGTYSELHWYW